MGSTSAILYSANNKIGLGVFFLFKSAKHQTSTSLLRFVRKNWATPALPCSLLHFPTSTPKPRAEGSSPSAPAKKPAKTLGFRRFPFFHVLHCYLVHFGSDFWFPHPSVPAAPLSSTQNAPGFALFGPNRVRFAIFVLFCPTKFAGLFLCILLHSDYKLKPSVMPCRREVSFLT